MSVDWSLFGGAETFDSLPRRTVIPNLKNANPPRGPPKNPRDFLWVMTEEPHKTRRLEILKSHPEVTGLMGYEPLTKWVVLFVISVQLLVAFYLRNTPWMSTKFLLAAYLIGGTANHNIFLAIHEITHNLAFQGVKANKLFSIITNLPIGIPYAMAFKRYHLEHHKNLGEDGIDTDIPTWLEVVMLDNVAGKAFFATFQILFYAVRPGFVRSQKLTFWHLLNLTSQLAFDVLIANTMGPQALLYLFTSSFFAGSLHPCAGHFIAEHYLWDGLDQETYSYYGPLNLLAYNVGYHNEHHDFPSVPWTRLPRLRALVPEVYDNLPSHPSWPMVIFNFIFDSDIGMSSRLKRKSKSPDAAKDEPVVTRDKVVDDCVVTRAYADSGKLD
ncbi:dihydroceramide delta-4-desaturase [Cantharellus anzutake]|uniref:dihydroceramide delta-4-desaturase n=1 Tax=Cantharellus anzutake TaxID=1750568 RepID=UPI001906F2AE|nr:dihydroceramide delta-4-desaturase [Cantharellus anzutake]KAF8325799.1 dihydroceramide delta-4-desaturase [Cantharellus anzutake]